MFDKLELKKEPGIYIFTNKVNGKKYVGETMDIQRRIPRYKLVKKNLRAIDYAFLKYGFDGFNVKVMYFPGITKDDLLDLEETFIFLESSLVTEHGYNICIKGVDCTGRIPSDETKSKISKSLIGNLNLKKPKSVTTKKRMSNSKMGRLNYKSLMVTQLDMDNTFIMDYDSIRDAGRITGIDHSTITKCCKKKYNSAGGYKWKYKEL